MKITFLVVALLSNLVFAEANSGAAPASHGSDSTPQSTPGATTSEKRATTPEEQALVTLLGSTGNQDFLKLRDGLAQSLAEHADSPKELAAAVTKLMDPLVVAPGNDGAKRKAVLDAISKTFPNGDIQKAIAAYKAEAERVDLFRDAQTIKNLPKNAFSMPGGFRAIVFKNDTGETIKIKSWRNRGPNDSFEWTENRFPDTGSNPPSVLTDAVIPPGAYEITLKPGQSIGWTVRRGNRDVGGAVVDKDNNPLEGYEGSFGPIEGTQFKGMTFKKKK